MAIDEIKAWILNINEPFPAKEAPAGKNPKEKRGLLDPLVEDGILKKKKISNVWVYFRPYETISSASVPEKPVSPPKKAKTELEIPKSDLDDFKRKMKDLEIKLADAVKENEKLELQAQELQHELNDQKEQVRKLKLHDASDDPWRDVAWEMAQVLSEMRGVTTREVLRYFGAPEED
ncbi:MAG: hypothetical protein ACFFDI_05475 [Promethearchaeota archaeon]